MNRTYRVTIDITVDPLQYDTPEQWSWDCLGLPAADIDVVSCVARPAHSKTQSDLRNRADIMRRECDNVPAIVTKIISDLVDEVEALKAKAL